jgi:AraC-like DNA-binding protein
LSRAGQGILFQGQVRKIVSEKIVEMNSLKGIDRFIQLLIILDTLGKARDEQMRSLSSIKFVHNLQPNQQSRIDRVCTYLNQYYKHNLRLEKVAAIANMSTTAFCRFFKTSTGKSFVKYLNELRIGHACKLLIESELTISEICFEVGFNNVSNFNRRFFELHVMSPKEYRKEFANKPEFTSFI